MPHVRHNAKHKEAILVYTMRCSVTLGFETERIDPAFHRWMDRNRIKITGRKLKHPWRWFACCACPVRRAGVIHKVGQLGPISFQGRGSRYLDKSYSSIKLLPMFRTFGMLIHPHVENTRWALNARLQSLISKNWSSTSHFWRPRVEWRGAQQPDTDIFTLAHGIAVSLFVDWLSLSNLMMRRAGLSCTQRRALSTSSHHQTRDSAVTHSAFNSQS